MNNNYSNIFLKSTIRYYRIIGAVVVVIFDIISINIEQLRGYFTLIIMSGKNRRVFFKKLFENRIYSSFFFFFFETLVLPPLSVLLRKSVKLKRTMESTTTCAINYPNQNEHILS